MRYLILTLSLILGLATSVSASSAKEKYIENAFKVGDVFYCVMDEFIEWNWDEKKFNKYKLEKFKFTITDKDTLQFGESGYLGGWVFDIVDFYMYHIYAETRYSELHIGPKNFVYSLISSNATNLILATCDRF